MNLRKALAAVSIAVVVLVTASSFGFDFLVERGIETVGPVLTGTTVEVEDVDISVFDGRGAIRGMVIGNPPGFETKYAYKLDEVRVDLRPRSILGGKLIIRDISVDAPLIHYEKRERTSNIDRILTHVQSKVGGGGDGDVDLGELTDSVAQSRKVQIDHLSLKDAQVRASGPVLKGESLDIPPLSIELRGLGTGPEGARISEVAAKVLRRVSTRVALAVTEEMLTLGLADRSRERDGRGLESTEYDEARAEEADRSSRKRGHRRRRRE